jgi:MoaA/NifB/PqqE/SkfB family radical SAM enzyme
MNKYPHNVTDIHIELTDKCQASCPMCAINYMGGKERPYVGQHEINIDDFKNWFSPEFLKNISNFYACGNYGDPIIAKDCLEIFDYVRSNTDARLSIHTNGSARNKQWWTKLAHSMKGNHDVTFGIDGFKDSHVLYRKGTDWDKIIENADAFINAGGYAKIDTLVFEHNQDEIERFKEEMLNMGFKHVNIKYTSRFYNMEKYPVYDNDGNHLYDLKPASENQVVQFIKLDEISNNIKIWEDHVELKTINPKCITKKEIYIDARGSVLPCCWVGSDMIEEPLAVSMSIHDLRNRFVDNTKNNFKEFTNLNLYKMTIDEILAGNQWDFLKNNKPWTCVKNCKND